MSDDDRRMIIDDEDGNIIADTHDDNDNDNIINEEEYDKEESKEEEDGNDNSINEEDEDDEERDESKEEECGGDGDDDDAKNDSNVSPLITLKRPPTAYFLFLSEFRPIVLADLIQKQKEEEKDKGVEVDPTIPRKQPSIAVVGKAIGDRWKGLTDSERDSYHKRSALLKKEYDDAVAANPALKNKRKQKKEENNNLNTGILIGGMGHESVLPLSRIKKLIDLGIDKSKKTSKEAVIMVEKATVRYYYKKKMTKQNECGYNLIV
jgi:hypothetical protein